MASTKLYTTDPFAAAVKKTKKPLPKRPMYIVPYNQYSRSAKALSSALGIFRTTSNQNGEEPRAIDVINWGNGTLELPWLSVTGSKVYNPPAGINIVRNKLKLFKRIRDSSDPARIPEFFETLEDAMASVNSGNVVFGRKTSGSCGVDIVTATEDINRFNTSDFWVVYKKKKAEFRIHIFKRDGVATVIDRQQKVLRKTDPVTDQPIDRSTVNFMIRNHRNGFIFARNEIDVPADVETQALKAFAVSGLDFGAVDVIWNQHEGKAYVLEINSAPGLEGTTLENYVAEFTRMGLVGENPKPVEKTSGASLEDQFARIQESLQNAAVLVPSDTPFQW